MVVSLGFVSGLFGFGVGIFVGRLGGEMGGGFGGDGADDERGGGIGDKAGGPGFHVVGQVEEEARAREAHHVGGGGRKGMGFGAGREERDDFGEIAGDFLREIEDGEEGGEDDGLGGFGGAPGGGAGEGGEQGDGKDSHHGDRIGGAGGGRQAGLQKAPDAL